MWVDSPVWGLVILFALLFMLSAVWIGRRRRAQLRRQADAATPGGRALTIEQLAQVRRTQRSADFLSALTQRIYFGLTLAGALGLWALPYLPLSEAVGGLARLGL